MRTTGSLLSSERYQSTFTTRTEINVESILKNPGTSSSSEYQRTIQRNGHGSRLPRPYTPSFNAVSEIWQSTSCCVYDMQHQA